MVAQRIHLVRHGEVDNPDGVLYGRLPGFPLTERGTQMAARTARAFAAEGRTVTRLYASPLQRAQQSAAPIAQEFGLDILTDDRLIEGANEFEGRAFRANLSVIANPETWKWVRNPFRPSWGEAYVSIAERMIEAMEDAWRATESGDVVLVSHQLPIWMVHRRLAGERLFHDQRKRRCALSSITTFERDMLEETFVEVGYRDPNSDVLSRDLGAV